MNYAPPQTPYREPWQPSPQRPVLALPLVLALGCACLGLFTGNKLLTAAQLRGDLPGISQRAMRFGPALRRFSPDQAMYALDDPSDTQGGWTIQLTAAQTESLRVGDTLVVRCTDDRECYVRDSIFINDDNMRFDLGLLALELAGALACAGVALRNWLAWRREDHSRGQRRSRS